MAESEIKITRIDPDGDVTLELSGPDGKSSLLVSSKALSLASPVFKAMFGSRFKEGLSNLSTTGKAPIPLPDDDMEAFTILCKIIHHQTNEIPRKLTLNCLESLATISDKYDCTKTLAPWGNTWLHSKIDYVHEEDHNKLLAVALVLDWPEPFSRISWDIILMHVGSFLAMPGLTDNSLVKYDLLVEFEARKAEINMNLLEAIEQVSHGVCEPGSATCNGLMKLSGKYLRNLEDCQLLPFTKQTQASSISTMLNRMLYVDDPLFEPCTGSCNICFKGRSLKLREKLRVEKDRISNMKKGLCLDCVTTGRESFLNRKCRVEHS